MTGTSVGPDATTNNSGATVVVAAPINGQTAVELKVPSLGIDVTLTNGTQTPGPNGSTLELAGGSGKYFLAGTWAEKTTSTSEISMFISGYQTPIGGLPTQGIATYTASNSLNGYVVTPHSVGTLTGSATLSANFGNGMVTGSLQNITATDAVTNVAGLWDTLSLNASIVSGTSAFTGATNVSSTSSSALSLGASATGSIDGRFYGPQADEVAAVWTLSDNNGAAVGVIGLPNKSSGTSVQCSLNLMQPTGFSFPAHPVSAYGLDWTQCPWWTTPAPFFASPIAATKGTNPLPAQLALPGGPTFDGSTSYPSQGTVFPLTWTSVDFASSGLVADTTSNTQPSMTVSGSGLLLSLTIPFAQINIPLQNPQNSLTGNTLVFDAPGLPAFEAFVDSWGLSYTGFGAWATSNNDVVQNVGYYMFGYETPFSAMPASGTATYSGTNTVAGTVFVPITGASPTAELAGDALLSVNFGTGSVTGNFSNMNSYTNTATMPWNSVSVNANIATGATTFSGTTNAASAPGNTYSLKSTAQGSVNGQFFGPSANELGAIWTLSNGDGTGSAFGIVGATKH